MRGPATPTGFAVGTSLIGGGLGGAIASPFANVAREIKHSKRAAIRGFGANRRSFGWTGAGSLASFGAAKDSACAIWRRARERKDLSFKATRSFFPFERGR